MGIEPTTGWFAVALCATAPQLASWLLIIVIISKSNSPVKNQKSCLNCLHKQDKWLFVASFAASYAAFFLKLINLNLIRPR